MDRSYAGIAIAAVLLGLAGAAQARTVYECLRDNRLSLSTAPEPGARCVARRVNDRRAKEPNFWGDLGPVRGPLYQGRIGGRVAYSTRAIPGWKEVQSVVSLRPPRGSWAHAGLGSIGTPFARKAAIASKMLDVPNAT